MVTSTGQPAGAAGFNIYADAPPPGAWYRAQGPGGRWYWGGFGDINLGNPHYLGATMNVAPGTPARWDPTFGWRNDFDPNRPGKILGEG